MFHPTGRALSFDYFVNSFIMVVYYKFSIRPALDRKF